MIKQLIPAIRATLVLAFLTGILFPLAVTAVSQAVFSDAANGSLIKDSNGVVVGSKIIGQKFEKLEYFHPRPSAAGSGWAGEASGGTNLGPTSAKLIMGKVDDPATKDVDESFPGVQQLAQMYRSANMLSAEEKPPVDAVTRSASGLDPDISEANAAFQARRVAKERSLPLETVMSLVRKNTTGRQWGMFGEPGVNVLTLNLALADLKAGNASEQRK